MGKCKDCKWWDSKNNSCARVLPEADMQWPIDYKNFDNWCGEFIRRVTDARSAGKEKE